MATRSLTEVFILMRNNALQSRNIFSDQVSKLRSTEVDGACFVEATGLADDRMALVSSVTVDPELGIASTRSSRLPPEWVDGVEEIQFEMTKIKEKMKELVILHDKHLNRPTLDDNVDEEHAIEIQTQEITQNFTRCQRLVQQINARSQRGTDMERKLSTNIVSSLARSLQDMSINFRKSQSTYLRKLQSREERSREFFDTNIGPESGLLSDDAFLDNTVYEKGFTGAQLQMVADNTAMVQQRDTEITQIVRSIQDLNEIFKDLSTMIVDQGTILDRIDYNIEHASVQVEKGLQQLQKAEKYQKKSRKMYIIVFLAILVILLIIILIAVKS